MADEFNVALSVKQWPVVLAALRMVERTFCDLPGEPQQDVAACVEIRQSISRQLGIDP